MCSSRPGQPGRELAEALARRYNRRLKENLLPLTPELQPRPPDPEQAQLGDELASQYTSVPESSPRLSSLDRRANIGARIAMPFDLQPTLKGPLVELRPLRAEDFPALYAVASDPLIWEQHPSPDRCQEPVFRVFFQEALACGGTLLARDSRTGQVIGSSRYYGYDEARSEIEIGWTFLARSHWGGSYNGEMKRLMLRHAFRFVDRVYFRVGPHNMRSQRAVEKIGGVRVGLRSDGGGPAMVRYEMTAASFAGG